MEFSPSDNLLAAFRSFAESRNLFAPHHRIIVACSGGVDSMVLAHLLVSLRQPLMLAHVNYGLRGEDSEADEKLVEQAATDWEVPCTIRRFDTEAWCREKGMGLQEGARRLRYDWFESLRADWAAQGNVVRIAVAHHADDALETWLFHMMRGTGIEGLRGMPVKRGAVIRPLLFARREHIEAYARHHGIPWREDTSNASDKYTRNRIRHRLLPAAEEVLPGAVEGMLHTMRHLSEASELYREALQQRLRKLVTVDKAGARVPVRLLEKQQPLHTIAYEVFAPYGFTAAQVPEILKLLHARNAAQVAGRSHRVVRDRNWLLILPLQLPPAGHTVWERPEDFCEVGHVRFEARMLEGSPAPDANPNVAWLDAKDIVWPLVVRPWRKGDYFYPLGMRKKKKIARFLIDLKLSPSEKERVLVVESEGRILWVAGYRIDDRFKLMPATKRALALKQTCG